MQWGSEYQKCLMNFNLSGIPMCSIKMVLNYSDHYLNTGPVFIWWSEYQTNLLQYSNGIWIPDYLAFEQLRPLTYRTSPVFRYPLYNTFNAWLNTIMSNNRYCLGGGEYNNEVTQLEDNRVMCVTGDSEKETCVTS